ncbi:MAG: glycine dehydrogenase, partial [Thermomicrobiales bacterium]
MTFNPHTSEDRAEMMAAIGIDSVESLFDAIPADVRFPTLDLPPTLTEMEAAVRMQELAEKNVVP